MYIMSKKHVQAVLRSHEYAALEATASAENLTIKEAVREATLAWVREKAVAGDALDRIVGIAKGKRTASARHDEDYLED
jgi:hypothetical protein